MERQSCENKEKLTHLLKGTSDETLTKEKKNFGNIFLEGEILHGNVKTYNENALLKAQYTNKNECEEKKSPFHKLSTSKILDVTPRNLDIACYCKALININFTGECDIANKKTRLSFLLDEPDDLPLSTFLQSMDTFLRSFGTDIITGTEEEYIYYLHGLMEKRDKKETEEVFWKDSKRFLEIYNARGVVSEALNHLEYWGTRQQLLAGKVIADYVDDPNGPLDPVFGVLLSPVAGRTGPGDSGIVHELLFDNDGPLAYHSAVHDAFGYLVTYHNIGPGYNYVGSHSLLKPSQCMAGQMSGLHFWRELLKSF